MTYNHTPGPWYVINERGNAIVRAEKLGAVSHVFVADCGLDFLAEDNARLIAAAPDLLAALEDALKDLSALSQWDRASACARTARAAIAKAKGE